MTNIRIKKKKPKTHFTEFSALTFAFAMPIQLNFNIFQNYFLIWSWRWLTVLFCYLNSPISFERMPVDSKNKMNIKTGAM